MVWKALCRPRGREKTVEDHLEAEMRRWNAEYLSGDAGLQRKRSL